MGYYTNFKVAFKQVAEQDRDLPFIQSDRPEAFVPVLNPLVDRGCEVFESNGWSKDTLKWYSWEEDMMAASRQMPGVLIILTGSGEEDGDIWRAYFLDGMVQCERPDISFHPFDPGRLRDKPHMSSRNQVNIWG